MTLIFNKRIRTFDTNASISIDAKVLDNLSVKEIQEIIHQLPKATVLYVDLWETRSGPGAMHQRICPYGFSEGKV